MNDLNERGRGGREREPAAGGFQKDENQVDRR